MTIPLESNGHWPVIIVGAGPVGLLLANLLGTQEIRCLLVEKRIEFPEWSRAIGITPPSLEIFGKAGLHRPFLHQGLKVKKAVVHDDFGINGSLDFTNLQSEYKFILTLPQSETMSILESGVGQRACVTYQRGLEVVGLERSDESVRVDIEESGNGRRSMRLTASWVIGCDGARSTVRNLAGLSFVRKAYRQEFMMADYEDVTPWGTEAHLFFTRRGSLESFPLPGNGRRWIALAGEGPREATKDAVFIEDQAKLLSGFDLHDKRRSPVFAFTPEKIAVSKLSSDRVVLAGDAAHVISPIGGQGMNTGLADAALLGSLIPELLKRDASSNSRLLEDYDRQRLTAARAARRRAALGMWLGTRTGSAQSTIRRGLLRHVLLKPKVAQRLAAHFAMLTIPGNRRPAEGKTG